MNDLLPARCLKFVQEQSGGEWGDEIEREDTAKLLAFVRAEIAYATQEPSPC